MWEIEMWEIIIIIISGAAALAFLIIFSIRQSKKKRMCMMCPYAGECGGNDLNKAKISKKQYIKIP
jgi:tRNA/tmRNA/rRNA uracil-C5-methylase (TrmA/RlmC/RlmD family)